MSKQSLKIVIILNHADRERKTLQKVQSAINQINPEAEVHLLEFRNPNFMLETLEIRPQVIMTFPFTAISTASYFYILKHLLDCVLVCFRAEGVLNYNSANHVQLFTGLENYGSNFVDYEVFWGPKTAHTVGDSLLRQNKLSSQKRIKYFGSPFIEDYINSADERNVALPQEIKNKFSAYSKERIVLIVTGFSLANYSPQDILGAGDIVDSNSQTAEQDFQEALAGVEITKQLRQKWIETIIAGAVNSPQLLLIVKIHPIESIQFKRGIPNPYGIFNNYPNIFLIADPIPFRAIVPYCGLLLHYGSTSALEAYLSSVPSIFVKTEIPGINTNKFTSFEEMTFLSSSFINLTQVPELIHQHAITPLIFQRNDKIEQVLLDLFNLKLNEDYQPSRQIAQFLLSLVEEMPQSIATDDQHLGTAFRQSGNRIIPTLIEKGIAQLNKQNYQIALEPYLNFLKKLALTGFVQIQQLYLMRSVCLFNLGLLKEALIEVEQELTSNPQDEQAQNWRQQVMAKMESSQVMEKPHSLPTSADLTEFDLLLPKIFTIETVLACSLKCPECAIGGDIIERQHTVMKLDRFKLIADKIRPFVKYLYLHLWGEPMLNKQIIPMIQYAAQFTRTNISTHAQVLSKEMADSLITSGVSDIIVSIDGVSQAVYERYRVGGDVKTALSNLALLQQLNQHYGGKVNIMPQFIMFKHNQHEKPLFEDYCHRLGLKPFFKPPYIRMKESKFAYSDFSEYIRPHYPTLETLRQAMQTCNAPRDNLVVTVDGSVIVCCHDYNGLTTFGNIFQQGVLEIWDSPKYREFRYKVLAGAAPEFCVDYCMTYLPQFETRSSRKVIPIVPGK